MFVQRSERNIWLVGWGEDPTHPSALWDLPSNQLEGYFFQISALTCSWLKMTWHRNLKHVERERTLSYATPQCIGKLSTFYIIQVTWLFEVQKQFQQSLQGSSPLFTYAERSISSKVHKMMQYTYKGDHMVLYGSLKVNMMKLHFNLLQLILVRILCDRYI